MNNKHNQTENRIQKLVKYKNEENERKEKLNNEDLENIYYFQQLGYNVPISKQIDY